MEEVYLLEEYNIPEEMYFAVSQQHIDEGDQDCSDSCGLALALIDGLKDKLKNLSCLSVEDVVIFDCDLDRTYKVNRKTVKETDFTCQFSLDLDDDILTWISNFDLDKDNVGPIDVGIHIRRVISSTPGCHPYFYGSVFKTGG